MTASPLTSTWNQQWAASDTPSSPLPSLQRKKPPRAPPGVPSAPEHLLQHVGRKGSAPRQVHARRGGGVAITPQPPRHLQSAEKLCHGRGEQPERFVKPGRLQHETQEHGFRARRKLLLLLLPAGAQSAKVAAAASASSAPRAAASRGWAGGRVAPRELAAKPRGCLGTPRAPRVPLDTAGSRSTEGKVTKAVRCRQRSGEGCRQAYFFLLHFDISQQTKLS